jgi:O-antigen/teichoic acid export membrane protein
MLILIQTVSVLVAAIVLFGRQPLAMLRFDWPTLRHECRPLLRFSLPLGGYTLLVLFSMGLDKWMARIWFPRDIFNTYVIDYQYAFAMVFVPTAINLYNGPRVSAYVARGQWDLLAQEERRAARLAVVGCLAVAVLMYAYAWASGLALSNGYWLLVVGFLFEGLYILRTNRLMAQLRSFRMLFISASGIAVYVILLALAAVSGNRLLLYLAVPAYLGVTLALAQLYTRMKHDPTARMDGQAGTTRGSGPGG